MGRTALRRSCVGTFLAASRVAVLLLALVVNGLDVDEGVVHRHLQQKADTSVTKITGDNAKDFKKIVEGAKNGAIIEMEGGKTYKISDKVVVTASVTLRAAKKGPKPIVKCTKADAGIEIRSDGAVMSGFILRDCTGPAMVVALPDEDGFVCFNRDPVGPTMEVLIENVDFINNKEPSDSGFPNCFPGGGALGVATGALVTVTKSLFEGNAAKQGGGILMQVGASVTVTDTTFRENETIAKGAGAAMFAGASVVENGFNSTLVVENCQFLDNKNLDGSEEDSGLRVFGGADLETSQFIQFKTPALSGGAIHVSTMEEVRIIGSTFDGNFAVPAGGAMFILDNKQILVDSCNFTNNHVEAPRGATGKDRREPLIELGGAMYVAFVDPESSITILRSNFERNSATFGGALHIVSPVSPGKSQKGPIVERCKFTNNRAHDAGGAIALRNSRETRLEAIIVTDNEAVSGGGLFFTNGAGARVFAGIQAGASTRFSRNRARDGGAWFCFGAGTISLTSARDNHIFFEDNKAIRNGGALALVESLASAQTKLEDAVFLNNIALRGGAIYLDSIARFSLQETAVEAVNAKNELRGNRAQAGGAVYARPSSQIINSIDFKQTKFFDNAAVFDLSEELASIEVPDFKRPGRNLLQSATTKMKGGQMGSRLVDPLAVDPCLPGGGGSICLVMNQVPERASVKVSMIAAVFQNSTAETGGALFISTEEGSEWEGQCAASTGCRTLAIRGSTLFKENSAVQSGGAIFATDPASVFFDEQRGGQGSFTSMDELMRKSDQFVRNTVGDGGYGQDFASTAARLEVESDMDSDSYFVKDHLSGHLFPAFKLSVRDIFNETVTSGIEDSELKVQVVSEAVSGQLVSGAVNGYVVFDAVTVTALPGNYQLTFTAPSLPNITAKYTIRPCIIGEFNVTENRVCTNCTQGFYGIRPKVQCDRCSPNAVCQGGPALAPKEGFWHSTPYSPQIHECLVEAACSYFNRTEILTDFFANRSKLNPSNDVLSNEVYPLCNEGYEGVLCGSCLPRYGHVGGGECADCGKRRSLNIFTIVLVAFWNLILMLFTIRSAMSSIRDLNEIHFMAEIQKKRALAGQGCVDPDSDQDDGSRAPPPTANKVDGEVEITTISDSHDTRLREKWGIERSPEQNQNNVPMEPIPGARFQGSIPGSGNGDSENGNEEESQNGLVTVDHIIGAENLSETVKIATNFLQVTSVALHINANWTLSIAKMLAVQDIVTGFSGGSSITPLDCVLNTSASNRSIQALVMRIFFPLVIMVFIIGLFYAAYSYKVRKSPPKLKFRQYAIITTIVALFFAYEKVTQDLMRTLNCVIVDEEVDPETDVDAKINETLGAIGTYWGEDTVHKCFEGKHFWLMVFLGVPGLILFAFGIPFVILCFLVWKKERKELMDRDFINTYGFLFQNYNEKFVYWEVAIMTRKALINGIIVFAYPLGANLQGVLAQGVLVVALVLQLVAHPYKYTTLNVLESASLVVSIFTFYSGIMYNDDNTSTQARVLLSTVLLALNFGLVILFLWRGYHLIDMIVTARLKNFRSIVPDSFPGRCKRLVEAYVELAKDKTRNIRQKVNVRGLNIAKTMRKSKTTAKRSVEQPQISMMPVREEMGSRV
ncbi:hypothetical protein BSKO_07741 [Bryopsis sp. KO-2023]|nr:hypothetical protein BSKO_07741 [Bryopsis sp. KO-2023]